MNEQERALRESKKGWGRVSKNEKDQERMRKKE